MKFFLRCFEANGNTKIKMPERYLTKNFFSTKVNHPNIYIYNTNSHLYSFGRLGAEHIQKDMCNGILHQYFCTDNHSFCPDHIRPHLYQQKKTTEFANYNVSRTSRES